MLTAASTEDDLNTESDVFSQQHPQVLSTSSLDLPSTQTQQQHQASEAIINNFKLESHEDKEPSIPRLVISKMVLENFKSYAGQRIIGPFHKSFTSIVGPNGSGKSNVIDSLLFVFGFKAKKMRQGKLSELIHHSANYPNLKYCQVSIHFQEIYDLPGPDEYRVVPNSHLVVSRMVEKTEKGDKSIYKVNGKPSSFTEVTTMLKAKGIDLDHKRFLILQGEVESISQMKPKAQNEHDDGLLEYLEDIISTSQYKFQIDELAIQVESLNEERSMKLSRVRMVEKETNAMKSERNEALQFLHDENDLVIKKNQLYQLGRYECQKEIVTLSESIDTMKKEASDAKTLTVEIEAEVQAYKKEFKKVESEYDELSQQTELIRKELQKYERSEVELKEKDKFLKSKQKKLTKTLQADVLNKSEDETWMQNFQNDLNRLNEEVQGLQARLCKEEKTLEEIQESLKGKTDVFQKQVEEKQMELVPWTEKTNQLQSEINIAQSEYDLLHQKVNASNNQIADIKETLKGLAEEKKDKVKEIELISRRKRAYLHEFDNAKRDLESLEKDETQAKSDMQEARQKFEEAKTALRSSQSRGHVHKSLMQQAKTGKIKGIRGRLGDLGVIDEKYDVAVTTACGALDNIVVDSVDVGQKCIQYLKENNIGRANFICLDKIDSRGIGSIDTPENTPRIFDLIKPKSSKYAPAFYYVLKNTLVAKDMDQANRIAFGKTRFRVVTLNGQVIDKSGTMSGGGTRQRRGGMSSKYKSDMDDVREEDVVALESRVSEAEAIYKKLSASRASLSSKLNEVEKIFPEFNIEETKVKMDLESLELKNEDGEREINRLMNETRSFAEEEKAMNSLQKNIANMTNQLQPVLAKSAEIESEIKHLQEQILEIGGIRLRSQKAKVDNISEQIASINQNITNIQVERNVRDKNLTKIQKNIEKKEAELNGIEQELSEITSSLETQRQAAVSIKEKVQESKKVLDKKEAKLNEMKEQLEEKVSMSNELRTKEFELKSKHEESEKRLIQLKHHVKHLEKEMGTLKLQPISHLENVNQNHLGMNKKNENDKSIMGNLNNAQDHMDEDLELEIFEEHELVKFDKETLKLDIKSLEAAIHQATPNLGILAEFKAKMEEHAARSAELQMSTDKRDEVKQQYDDLRNRRLDEFMTGFTIISQKLKEMYQMITLGGNAELELVDSLDPFSEGIVFSVMPPKKSWKNISNLSGGEKTLSSLALVFALHHYKPTPLYVMDEIDAALDFRNVSIVANYIKERTKNAQFVIISLRNNMFELADRLVGIYKTQNATKSVTIDPRGVQIHAE